VEGAKVVGGTVVGATVATVEATTWGRSPSGSRLMATTTTNAPSASNTDPPAISSPRRAIGSMESRTFRSSTAGLWISEGTSSRHQLLSPPGGPGPARGGCGGPPTGREGVHATGRDGAAGTDAFPDPDADPPSER